MRAAADTAKPTMKCTATEIRSDTSNDGIRSRHFLCLQIDINIYLCYNVVVLRRMIRGALAPTSFKEDITMKVNPKAAKFVLDLIAAVALAAAGVITKYYLEVPQN